MSADPPNDLGSGADGELRASDADRERVAQGMRDHFSTGRLTEEELSARVTGAYDAQTLSDLERLTADLPARSRATSEDVVPARRRQRRQRSPARAEVTRGGHHLRTSLKLHVTVYVFVNLMLVGVWAASGGGYFWPVWPLLGWGMGLAGHAAPVIAGVGTRRGSDRRQDAVDPAASAHAAAATGASARAELQRAAAPDGTVTILFTDIEGSTALNEQLGDVRWLELLRRHHELVREQVDAHHGFEVKAQGDGFMLAFASARDAVQCARSIQNAIAAGLGEHPAGPVRVRIGLHTGEAIREASDYYGRDVVVAARIADHAQGGEILASAVVRQLAGSAGGIRFEDEREVALAGLAGTHTVYTVG
ncbi:hypothetical protein DSM112329_00391 [Paraconexibacter sp. AEG42_29]|uniref:Guanylate cyclase domain-containing protein n=1 Tax=Paraconexibacter sp. AEG42_29 TaxID=2997339 RepID=A0AAU7APN8_9ACTN